MASLRGRVTAVFLFLVCFQSGNNGIQPTSAGVVGTVAGFIYSLVGRQYTSSGTLHINGSIYLQNHTTIQPLDGVYWPNAELSNPHGKPYNELVHTIGRLILAFYKAIGGDLDSMKATIQNIAEDALNGKTGTAVLYTVKFTWKNETSLFRPASSDWTLQTFQNYVTNGTAELAHGRIGETFEASFRPPFTWAQVTKHEIQSFISSKGNIILSNWCLSSVLAFAVTTTMLTT